MSDEIGEKQKPVKRPHGLGRGLSALLGDVSREEPVAASANSAAPSSKAVQNIEVALIQPHPEQPRRHFDQDALQELADSIAKRGVIQPIIVRPHGGGFQIVAGERRWRAAQKAQLHRIPAIVRDFDEQETLEIALVENIQREDLNP
ncbi:MAG: ParB/RepB/Spo0J family partition protein, partial [Sphingobium yanoikuyae]|nr:ParB/RepB/Spo0J family partition protein [Sphingobium yanoikuyae]